MKVLIGLKLFLSILFCCIFLSVNGQKARHKVVAFYTAKNDQAHISFVHEANKWLSEIASRNNFVYVSTDKWENLNEQYLSGYDLVIFLDTRPENHEQRKAFEVYMRNGGAWLGFHFAAFALTLSTYPQDWNWYHEEFLGSGEYNGNTWKPTPAVLKTESKNNPVVRGIPATFASSANEWYSWKNDLRKNPDIEVLLSIDTSSFPLGTGPKPHEIWHSGDYPVVWTNKKYRMIYINMGHNDIDYDHGTSKELSFTFTNPTQNKLVINCLKWLMKN